MLQRTQQAEQEHTPTALTSQTVPGSWSRSGTGLKHKAAFGNLQFQLPSPLVHTWRYPGTEWYGKGKDGCGEAQRPHMLLVLNNL